MIRSTKIVATLGPATDPEHVLEDMIAAGMDVARINFSHGTEADHRRRIAALRAAAAKAGRFIAVMADLPGPKLRAVLNQPQLLSAGTEVWFSLLPHPAAGNDLCITEPELLKDVQPGHTILLDDGRIILEAGDLVNNRLGARVKVGGLLMPNKGVNLPDTPLSLGALTPRDREALAVACDCGVDWLALSFVRSAAAAVELREAAAQHGYQGPVMAKIERPEAVARIEDICLAFDGIMVARGDLGVEMLLEVVPSVQKKVILAARRAGKPVITATEMLDSMTKNPRPTRAETSDVANAILDGTDAVMLSGETAIGDYPVEAVACMSRIAWHAEAHMRGTQPWNEQAIQVGDVNDSMAQAACELCMEVFASAIVAPSVSGSTAMRLARHRPWACIVAVAQSEAVLRRLAVVWGLRPVLMSTIDSGQDRLAAAIADAHRAGAVTVGDRVVVLAGHPIERGPRIPTLRIVRVGEGGTSLEP